MRVITGIAGVQLVPGRDVRVDERVEPNEHAGENCRGGTLRHGHTCHGRPAQVFPQRQALP